MKGKITKQDYIKLLDAHDWYFMMKSFQYDLKYDKDNENLLREVGEKNGWLHLFQEKINERDRAISSEF